MTYVVDSPVALKSVLPEIDTPYGLRVEVSPEPGWSGWR